MFFRHSSLCNSVEQTFIETPLNLNPSTVLDALHTKMSECEQLLAAVNCAEVVVSAAAKKDK